AGQGESSRIRQGVPQKSHRRRTPSTDLEEISLALSLFARSQDVECRKKIAEEAGIGFSLPTWREHENVPSGVSVSRPQEWPRGIHGESRCIEPAWRYCQSDTRIRQGIGSKAEVRSEEHTSEL